MRIELIGVPVEAGASRPGCAMGPAALRTAGLVTALRDLGHEVEDAGDLASGPIAEPVVAGHARNPGLIAAWVRAVDAAGRAAIARQRLPIFLGGDHSLATGSVNAVARAARAAGRPLTVLWLDAHSDFNTPATSVSGNLHGMPVAALVGEPGLEFLFDGIAAEPLAPGAIHLFGIRSVDALERTRIRDRGLQASDMRRIDEHGVGRLIAAILHEVEETNAMLHVSFDVDFLDPGIAPGVGTACPGGATYREAHLIMELLADSRRVTSLDVVELNPFLDVRGTTACLLVDLVASLFGRNILDQP